MRTIKQCITEPGLHSDIASYVATFNALMLPKGYMYVSDDMLVHLVIIDMKNEPAGGLKPGTLTSIAGSTSGGFGLFHGADVIWKFRPQTGIWTTTKDHTGNFESLCPIKCGGMPEVKRNA